MGAETLGSIVSSGTLCWGDFRLHLKPDGTVVVPDLTEEMIPLLRALGVDGQAWKKQPCAASSPILLRTRNCHTGLSLAALQGETDTALWAIHEDCQRRLDRGRKTGQPTPIRQFHAASLLDLKIQLARRLLSPCLLCERQCRVNRLHGETGFCGLAAKAQLGAFAMLYNEGPLVGAPTFSVFFRGCALRCSFCYRPGELDCLAKQETSPRKVAAILDLAAENGAQSWHFLGGNPDESLPGILEALSLTTRSLPVVWNSALFPTPAALSLLRGVVDVWLPDFKFGNDECARRIAGVNSYTSILKRNLLAIADQDYVVVRHIMMPGHSVCCTSAINRFLLRKLGHFLVDFFPLYSTSRTTPVREELDQGLQSTYHSRIVW